MPFWHPHKGRCCRIGVMETVLEVIALTVDDARAAAAGGADRLEVVAHMDADGLTPNAEIVGAMRAAVDIPLRVMLRPRDAFAIDADELDRLCDRAIELAEAGAEAFVFGYLAADDELDVPALTQLAEACGRPWTLHRAFDRVADPRGAYHLAAQLPGLDHILTAGSASGVDVATLIERAPWTGGPTWLIGGGLQIEHLKPLYAAGIREFHIGTAARESWDAQIDPVRVAAVRAATDQLNDSSTSANGGSDSATSPH